MHPLRWTDSGSVQFHVALFAFQLRLMSQSKSTNTETRGNTSNHPNVAFVLNAIIDILPLSTGVLLSRGSPRSSGRGWHERDRSVSLAACGTASIDISQKENDNC